MSRAVVDYWAWDTRQPSTVVKEFGYENATSN